MKLSEPSWLLPKERAYLLSTTAFENEQKAARRRPVVRCFIRMGRQRALVSLVQAGREIRSCRYYLF